VTKCSAENLSVAVFANNQLAGYTYDSAGNMTHDATTNTNYSFNQENRITGAAGYSYTVACPRGEPREPKECRW